MIFYESVGLVAYLYCGRAQPSMTNVIPMDPAKASVTSLKTNKSAYINAQIKIQE